MIKLITSKKEKEEAALACLLKDSKIANHITFFDYR
jgi:hypothetical protein